MKALSCQFVPRRHCYRAAASASFGLITRNLIFFNPPKYLPTSSFSFALVGAYKPTRSLAAQQGSGKLIRALRTPHGKGQRAAATHTHTHVLWLKVGAVRRWF